MGKYSKRIWALLTAAVLAVSVSACSLPDGKKEPPVSNEVLAEFTESMNTLCERGYEYKLDDARVLSNFYYALSLSGTASLRLAIDRILYNRGEGESFAEVVGVQPYAQWDEARRISRVSPYPAFFEGLIYEMQGNEEEAELCYREAQLCDGYTLALHEFLFLQDLSTEELYALRGEVAKQERLCHSQFDAVAFAGEMSYLDWLPEYHIELARQVFESDNPDFATALGHYENALAADPFNIQMYICCALSALYAEKADDAQRYIAEGLFVAPENGSINAVAAALYCAAGETEQARQYLKVAKAGDSLPEYLKTLVTNTEAELGGTS